MYKKLMYLISIILVVCLAGPGWAAVTSWDGGAIGNLWRSADNWNNGVPTSSSDYYIDLDGANVIVDSITTAYGGAYGRIGWTAGRSCSLQIVTGGSLSAGDTVWLGYSGSGTLNMSGGTFTVSGGSFNNIVLGQNAGGTNAINMTGGSIDIAGTLYVYNGAAVHLDGGTIEAGTLYISDGLDMDISGGTLILDGDDTSTIDTYVSAGKLTARDGDGIIVRDYNITNAGQTTVTGEFSGEAEDPSPSDDATGVAIDSNLLTWTPGPWATDHNVYFGTSFSDVNTGAGGTYKGQVGTNSFAPGDYSYSTDYYWRIDEVNASHPLSPAKGFVWHFTTESAPPPPAPEATNPSPSDDATWVAVDSNLLTWTPGPWATDHNVYFGTSFSDVNTGAGGTYKGQVDTNSFAPGDYNYVTDYYWRIDEVNTSNPNSPFKGDVWHFKTESECNELCISQVAQTGYVMATFQSHNQKVVSNSNGIFITYDSEASGNETWHLDRSTDGGQTWSSVYTRTIATRAPAIETDSSNNIYLAHPDYDDGDDPIYFYRFLASSNYTNPSISKFDGHPSDAKHSMAYDASRGYCYFATQYGKILTINASTGALVTSQQVLTTGDNSYPQYQHLAMDSSNNLHLGWTTGSAYYSIHHVYSTNGGANWYNMGSGSALTTPFKCDDSGPATMISYADETSVSTWLANMLPKGDKVHFCYVAWTTPQRIHYMRYDRGTGVREIDTWTDANNVWGGDLINLRPYDAFFTTDDISDPNSPLYAVSNESYGAGYISALVSTDNGSTWSDYATTATPIGSYAMGGSRMVTSDGTIIGAYTTGSPYCVDFLDAIWTKDLTRWTGHGSGNGWDTAGNWDNRIPEANDDVWVDISGASPVISAGVTAYGGAFGRFGYTTGRSCSLTMTGGTLTFGDSVWFGYNGSGTLNMSGGTFTIAGGNYNNIVLGQYDTGNTNTINMTGGTIDIANTLYVYNNASVHLDGGTIEANNLDIQSGEHMDISGGTLILYGDDTSTIDAYVTAGRLTAYDGSGTIVRDYNVTNPGHTTVTATE